MLTEKCSLDASCRTLVNSLVFYVERSWVSMQVVSSKLIEDEAREGSC